MDYKRIVTFATLYRAQMAESVDALVSNTSGFTSMPVRPRLWVRLKRLLIGNDRQAFLFLEPAAKGAKGRRERLLPPYLRFFLIFANVNAAGRRDTAWPVAPKPIQKHDR